MTPEWVRSLGIFGIILSEIIGLTGGGVAVGWLAHKHLGTPLVLAAVLGMVGLVGAFVRIHRAVERLERPRK